MKLCLELFLAVFITYGGVLNASGYNLFDSADVSRNFVYVLKREMFFNTSGTETEIQFMPLLVGKPDPPRWLTFVQGDELRNGYLFGTPQSTDDSTKLEILAINKDTYDTSTHVLDIKVDQREVKATYFLELRITNFNLDEILSSNHLETLLSRVKRLWLSSDDVYVTNIRSLLEEGARIPIPNAPGKAPGKQGVLVQFGGTADFSTDLKAVEVEIRDEDCHDDGGQQRDVRIASFFSPRYKVDWCKYRLIVPDMVMKPSAPPSFLPIDLNVHQVELHAYDVPTRVLQDDFILTVVFSVILAILLFLLLSYLMFGCREGLEKRNKMTPDVQMKQFASIRRATNNLRYMSVRRDMPPPPIGLSSYGQREGGSCDRSIQSTQSMSRRPQESDPVSLRGVAPPPYRLPPSYPHNTGLSYVPENTAVKERVHFDMNNEERHLQATRVSSADLAAGPQSSSC